MQTSQLLAWSFSPTKDQDELTRIMNKCSDADLLHLMIFEDDLPAHLGWAEYGLRRGFTRTAYKVEGETLRLPGGIVSFETRQVVAYEDQVGAETINCRSEDQ